MTHTSCYSRVRRIYNCFFPLFCPQKENSLRVEEKGTEKHTQDIHAANKQHAHKGKLRNAHILENDLSLKGRLHANHKKEGHRPLYLYRSPTEQVGAESVNLRDRKSVV